jgi:hypothetical protein
LQAVNKGQLLDVPAVAVCGLDTTLSACNQADLPGITQGSFDLSSHSRISALEDRGSRFILLAGTYYPGSISGATYATVRYAVSSGFSLA